MRVFLSEKITPILSISSKAITFFIKRFSYVNLIAAAIQCYRIKCRGGYRTAATSKMEHFVRRVNDWKRLTITIKRTILDVTAVLDPPLKWKIDGYSFYYLSITRIITIQDGGSFRE